MQKIKTLKIKKGFTALEVLLVTAVIVVLAGFSIPVYRYFQVQNNVDVARSAVVHSLRRAQILSQSVDGDESWGVDIRNGGITMFKGSDYVSRDGDYDEFFEIPDNIAFSGVNEVVFSKVFGVPDATGTITITSVLGDSVSVFVNSKGMVSY